jgi:hypothetical protein
MAVQPAEQSPISTAHRVGMSLTSDDTQRLLDRAFDEFDIADLLESHSELVLTLTETIEQLEDALEWRGTIGRAIGICMERYSISDEQAFQFLTRLSQDHNIKLRQVAAHLVTATAQAAEAGGE